ncbi:hypothetical protein NPIL_424191 [Nephila pilipes]|uniref:Uncharacterized protein n=1 Tax=Nephila pilipes TaxID=299642 RepID=A0A8X6NFR5_NEPPI|nr:hypothetical protein NPIL_424191 [Nephila pilipes]
MRIPSNVSEKNETHRRRLHALWNMWTFSKNIEIARKVDLITLAEELGLTVEPNAKVSDLIKLITNDKKFDEELTKTCLEVINNERLEKRKDELEKRDNELKKLELESKAIISDGNVPLTVPKLNLMKLMPRYDVGSDISVYL